MFGFMVVGSNCIHTDQITFGPNLGCLVSKKQHVADKNYVVYEVTSCGFCFIQNRIALLVDAVPLFYSPLSFVFFLLHLLFMLSCWMLICYVNYYVLLLLFLFVVLNNYSFIFWGTPFCGLGI